MTMYTLSYTECFYQVTDVDDYWIHNYYRLGLFYNKTFSLICFRCDFDALFALIHAEESPHSSYDVLSKSLIKVYIICAKNKKVVKNRLELSVFLSKCLYYHLFLVPLSRKYVNLVGLLSLLTILKMVADERKGLIIPLVIENINKTNKYKNEKMEINCKYFVSDSYNNREFDNRWLKSQIEQRLICSL